MVKAKAAFTVLLMVSLLGIAACSDDDGDEGGTTTGAEEAGTTAGGDDTGTSANESTEPLLIKTHLAPINARGESAGDVLAGSTIGDSPFCPGGRFSDVAEESSTDESVVRVFRCPGGTLTITFSPGPDLKASGDWKVVRGLAGFEGFSGGGRMRGVLESRGGEGRETFTGTVTRP
jgi:hypothetical protein